MSWDQIRGNWKQVTGNANGQWGKLARDDLDAGAGHLEQHADQGQERYGAAKESAGQPIGGWQRKATDSWFTKP